MMSPEGRQIITFNGEIYNFRELRSTLEAEGEIFCTQTDTEVLLRLYVRRGARMLDALRGMFAFAIWDIERGECFLARDGFGIKPLYYSTHDGSLVFASELKALQGAGLTGGRLNALALAGYFESGAVPEPETLIEGVFCLEAGHWLLWKNGALTKSCWWEPRFPAPDSSTQNAAATLREALIDSVRHHHVSDVPVGVFLSGGMDSTALVALSRLAVSERFKTFSLGVEDTHLNESGIARKTAAHFDTDHHELHITDAHARTLFAEFLQAIDQPTIDGFNTFLVSTLAREHGIKVVLSGLGSDELFGGYASFTRLPRLLALSKPAQYAGPVRRMAARTLGQFAPHGGLRRLAEYLHGPLTLRRAYRAFRGIFTQRESRRLAAHFAGCDEHVTFSREDPSTAQEEPTLEDQISALELRHYLRNQLLKDNDVVTMSRGIELRVPFIDRPFFERVSSLSATQRLQPGKRLLLEAVPEIPEWVSRRPKSGFQLPFFRWMCGHQSVIPDTAFTGLPADIDHWNQQMCLLVLTQWLRRHHLGAVT